MQSLLWYERRLRAMSLLEAWWRVRAKLQESIDLFAAPFRRRARLPGLATCEHRSLTDVRGEVIGSGWRPGTAADNAPAGFADWRAALIAQADRIRRNRVSIFDLEDHELGREIDWNYEYAAARRTPMRFAPQIDYRDYAVTGDAKVVWELNRHHHLVILGRAYRLTGDMCYVEAMMAQIESWVKQCPFGLGMNWRSPLELAIRVINWVWALELVRPSGVFTGERAAVVLPVVYRHLWEVSRKYSRYSSANNHLIGEAAGVFIGSSYFASLKGAAAWRRRSGEILLREIAAQTHLDGGHCELAMGYHMFVLQLFLLAGLVARNTGNDFTPDYWQRLERMFEFVAAFAEGGSALPMLGDCDDGYVLDLGGRQDDGRSMLAVGAVLFGRSDFKALSGGFSEPAFWLLGKAGSERFEGIAAEAAPGSIRSRAFAQSGYYLLQCGRQGGGDRISVVFDCGDLGFGPIAAHGHADALSFTLRAFGTDIFVDPGTYDYFTSRRWRDYFRSTRAHNTVAVDGLDQSEMHGPFLWGRRARARCIRWEPTEYGGTICGEHNGYRRLADPVVHRRTIALDGRQSELAIHDELAGAGRHEAALYLHLAEQCRIESAGGNRYTVSCDHGEVFVELDPGLAVCLVRASEDPILGWVSRGYHRKAPSTTLVARCQWTGHLAVETHIRIGERSDRRRDAGAADELVGSHANMRCCS